MRIVLVGRFAAIGDVAMAVPVVYSACRCYPGRRFVVLTRPSMVSIFAHRPDNLEVLGIDLQHKYSGLGGLRHLATELGEKYSPDIYVDLQATTRTRLLGLLLRITAKTICSRIGSDKLHRRELTRSTNKVMLPVQGIRDRYADAFARAGLPVEERFDDLYDGHATAPADAYAAITKPKPAGMRWLGIAPFAAHKAKVYPPELMKQVLDKLARTPDLRIFLLGGAGDEAATLEAWAAEYPNVTCLAGQHYGFGAETALFNHLDCMLTMDSCNMQLAAISGTTTLSIWGATHPFCGISPWRQTEENTIQVPITCRPCSATGERACARGDLMCLRAIRPDTVVDRVLALLG